jgi:hypothetical protein
MIVSGFSQPKTGAISSVLTICIPIRGIFVTSENTSLQNTKVLVTAGESTNCKQITLDEMWQGQ